MNVLLRSGYVAYLVGKPLLRVLRPALKKLRARMMLYDENGRILLVKSWFGRQRWALPGGGIESGETPEQAAVRELREETGSNVDTSQLTLVGTVTATDDPPFEMVIFKAVTTADQVRCSHRYPEIIAIKWWNVAELPDDVAPSVRTAIDLSNN